MSKIAELEALAKAATPGPWIGTAAHAQGYGWVVAPEGGTCTFGQTISILNGQYRNMGRDALYIAAANPETILRLLALVEQQHEALEFASDFIPPSACKVGQCAVCKAIEAYEQFDKGE